MKHVRFSPESETDLRAIYDHIRRGGSERKWRGFYEGSHVICYRETDIGIEVLRIVHGRRERRRALGQQPESSMGKE